MQRLSSSWFWRLTCIAAVAAVFYLAHALTERDLEPAAHAQSFGRHSQYPEGSNAAIHAAAEIVFARYKAAGHDWADTDSDTTAARDIAQVASALMRQYRPFVAPQPRQDAKRPPTVQPGEALQPGR